MKRRLTAIILAFLLILTVLPVLPFASAEEAPCDHSNTELRDIVAATTTAEGYSGDLYCIDCGAVVEQGTLTTRLDFKPYAVTEGNNSEWMLFGKGKLSFDVAVSCAYIRSVFVDDVVKSYTVMRLSGSSARVSLPDTVLNSLAVGPHKLTVFTIDGGEAAALFFVVPCDHSKLIRTNVTPATCTEKGYSGDLRCSACAMLIEIGEILPVTDHTYENGICTYCGAEDPNYERPRIFSANLSLTENFNMIYLAFIPEGCNDPYMVFHLAGKEIIVDHYTVDYTGLYAFTLEDIAPQQMGDNISAALYIGDADTPADCIAEYSIRTYCIDLLLTYCDDSEIDIAMRTLLSDLLTYGAAAQLYMGYRTDALVTDGLKENDALRFCPTPYVAPKPQTVSFTGAGDPTADWASASLLLGSKVAMRFTFYASSVNDLSVIITLDGSQQIYNKDDFEDLGNGKYRITYHGIDATQYEHPVIASFSRNGIPVGRIVEYSVNAYLYTMQNNEAVSHLAELVHALFNYGNSAVEFVEAVNGPVL